MARLHRPSTATSKAPTDPAAAPAVPVPGVASVSVAQLRPRRSPRLVAGGVLLACLGGLGGAFAYQGAAHSNDVVVVAHSVPRGQTIGPADLSTVTIGPAPGVHTVPAAELSQLVGKQALVDLPQGSLVGRDTVGVAALPAGSVQLVEVGDGKSPAQSALVVDAVLVTSPVLLADGSSRTVDVTVPATQSARLAELAAHDLLVMVRKAGG